MRVVCTCRVPRHCLVLPFKDTFTLVCLVAITFDISPTPYEGPHFLTPLWHLFPVDLWFMTGAGTNTFL